ncbi:MAG TPA: MgtC/SapB family protein [Ktedonobacteraceae bacterium]|nr:MgtC/SapB family protein [Ktedonobacteraceae bacterium]
MISLPVILLRLALALILGSIIGLEREFKEHKAGMRTNALVSLGSALFTTVSAYGFLDMLSIKGIQIDPSRVASYVVAGIGFLGAGAIVVRHGNARGLTTAAAIWMVAAIGMACGVGLYWEAVVGCLLSLVVLRGLRRLEGRLVPSQPSALLQLSLAPGQAMGALIGPIYASCEKEGLKVENVRSYKADDHEILELKCHISNKEAAWRVLAELRNQDSVNEGILDFQE